MENFSQLLLKHLQSNNVFKKNPPWVLKSSALGGRGLFAKRDIKPGETVFKDGPLLIGPRAKISNVICVNCYTKTNVHPCFKNCGLPVCSKNCENSDSHRNECQLLRRWKNQQEFSEICPEILTCLTPIRGLLLKADQKELIKSLASHDEFKRDFEVDTLKENLELKINDDEANFISLTSAVLDTNAFEVLVGDEEDTSSLRGLYTLSSLLNHSCLPNTTYGFDCNQNMVVKATSLIRKDQEIFHCYTKLLWGTYVRRPYLMRTKCFFCSCHRCKDPTEFGTNLSAITCFKCKGLVLPFYVKNLRMRWKCISCTEEVCAEKAGIILTMLGKQLCSFESSEPEEILEFLKRVFIKYAPTCNQIAVQLKCRLVWILGYNQKYLWGDLSEELLDEKHDICRELLQLLTSLGAGRSKMRGLLLYELYCCLRERQRRLRLQEIDAKHESVVEDKSREMEELFQESREILTDDVHAPTEIKQYNLGINEKPIQSGEIILAG